MPRYTALLDIDKSMNLQETITARPGESGIVVTAYVLDHGEQFDLEGFETTYRAVCGGEALSSPAVASGSTATFPLPPMSSTPSSSYLEIVSDDVVATTCELPVRVDGGTR